MDRSLLAQRYATALFEFASERKQGKTVVGEMKSLVAAWERVPELKKALESPVLKQEKKLQLLQTAAGMKKDGILSRFFLLVAAHNRLWLLGRIARAFIEIWNNHNGIVRSALITVGKVGKNLSLQLEEVVQKAVGNKKVEFTHSYDPDIIGGFIMQVEDLRIDASVRRELEYIKMNLLQ